MTALTIPEIVELAAATSSVSVTTAFGPIPLTYAAATESDVADVVGRLAGSDGPSWEPLTVVGVTSAAVPVECFPAELRPAGEGLRVARRGPVMVLSSGPERAVWILDDDRRLAVRWTTEGAVPPWERISPLQHGSRWWAARNGGATVHAGAVANERGAALLVGSAGAGKSTTSMACHGRGLDVLADDFCFVRPPTADEPAVVESMYRFAKLDDRSLALLPHLRERSVGPGMRGKTLVDMETPARSSAPIRVVCHVVQTPGGTTRAVPLSRQRALLAVAPSSMFQVRLFERPIWEALSATVRAVDCVTLEVGDVRDVPDVVAGLIDG